MSAQAEQAMNEQVDLLLAAHVMRWQVEESGRYMGQGAGSLWHHKGPGYEKCSVAFWQPSVDMDQAAQALQRLKDEDGAEVQWTMKFRGSAYYECSTRPYAGTKAWAKAETPAMAMCLCALRAAGVQEPLIEAAMARIH